MNDGRVVGTERRLLGGSGVSLGNGVDVRHCRIVIGRIGRIGAKEEAHPIERGELLTARRDERADRQIEAAAGIGQASSAMVNRAW